MTTQEPNMPTNTISTVLNATRPLTQDIYDALKAKYKTKKLDFTLAKLQSGLTAKLKDISSIKTLLYLETAVVLTEFYSPQHLYLPGRKRQKVNTPADLDEFDRLIVAGVAGQGKSVLFRYLAIQDVIAKRLPIFCELRYFADHGSLLKLLANELRNLGLPDDDLSLNLILNRKTTTIYLDAFDEIPLASQKRARSEIEDFSRRYEARVRLSSRPSLKIEASSFFRVARLSYLQNGEALDALKRMCRDSDKPDLIVTELKRSSRHLIKLLDTPLMVTLLLLHYRLTSKFPDTEQGFFNDLFEVLLRRHDQTKGLDRDRHSDASEIELGNVFDFISYLSRKTGNVEMLSTEFAELCEQSSSFYNKQFSGSDTLRDIVDGTNLLLEEGPTCRYAHKSIQEFHAAKFLVKQPEDNIATFLTGRIKKWNEWEQVLAFIELQDEYIFRKHFLHPHIGWIAFGDEQRRIKSDWKPVKKVFERVFGSDRLGLREGNHLSFYGCGHMSQFYLFRRKHSLSVEDILQDLDLDGFAPDPMEHEAKDGFQFSNHGDSELRLFSVSRLLQSPFGDQIRSNLLPLLRDCIPEILASYEFVDHRASLTKMFE